MLKKLFLGVLAFVVILIVIVVLYLVSISAARPEAAPEVNSNVHQAAFQSAGLEADNWLKSMYANNQLPSMSAAVGINGDLVWAGAIGYADLDEKVPATFATRYRIGSISKSLTAAAVMRMSEKGSMDINSPFNAYVKDFSEANTGYTIKHLLSHQAGVRHYGKGFSENYNTKEYASTSAAASIVKNDALLFTPGSGFNYSTYGYNLLALAMEARASLSLQEIMARDVFVPNGMSETHVDSANLLTAVHTAEPYLLMGDFLFEAPVTNLSDRYAGGGYLSTPTDLVKFGNALIGNHFLAEESKNVLWTPVPLANGAMNPENYALGYRVGQDDLGRFVHHGGMSIGGYSLLIIYPDLGVVMAFVSNFTPMEPSFDRLGEAKKVVRFFNSSK